MSDPNFIPYSSILTDEELKIYERLSKIKGSLFRLIAAIEHQQSILISRLPEDKPCNHMAIDGTCTGVMGCSFIRWDPLTNFRVCGIWIPGDES